MNLEELLDEHYLVPNSNESLLADGKAQIIRDITSKIDSFGFDLRLAIEKAGNLYGKSVRPKFLDRLLDYTLKAKNKGDVINLVNIMSSDHVIGTIKKYENDEFRYKPDIRFLMPNQNEGLLADVAFDARSVFFDYSDNAAFKQAFNLGYFTEYTDKRSLIQITQQLSGLNPDSVEIPRKLEEYAKEDIAFNVIDALFNTAEATASKEAVLEVSKALNLYKGSAAAILARRLKSPFLFRQIEIKNLAKMMSLDEVLSAVRRNEGDSVAMITEGLINVAASTCDKDVLIKAANSVSKYKGNLAGKLAEKLGYAAIFRIDHQIFDLNESRDSVVKLAEIMSLDEVVNVINGYNEDMSQDKVFSAMPLLNMSTSIWYDLNNRDTLLAALNAVTKYNSGFVSSIIADYLREMSDISKNNERMSNLIDVMSWAQIVNTINNRKVENSVELAFSIMNMYYNLGNKDILADILETAKKYPEDTETDIISGLCNLSFSANSETIIGATKLVNKIGTRVLNLFNSSDLANIRDKKLDEIIDSKDSFNAVASYIKSNGELALPNKENISKYEEISNKYIADNYGVKRKFNLNQILMLFSVKPEERKEFFDLINNTIERDYTEYSLSMQEDEESYLNLDKDKLTYLSLIAVTGSRDKKRDREAFKAISQIVGEKTVRAARNSFNSNYKNKMIKMIANYVDKGDTIGALTILKSANDAKIDKVLDIYNQRDKNFILKGESLLSAVESNNPLDYDSSTQLACVYLPRDYKKGIYKYCTDFYDKEKRKGFVLVRYDVNGNSIGSAICYMQDDDFLVDSVEGHRTFRKPQIFEEVYKDLVKRAKSKGARRVIFNSSVLNETPLKFIRYLGGKELSKAEVKLNLDTEGYLEADKNKVEGYIYEFNTK